MSVCVSPAGVLVDSHLRPLIYIMSHSNVNEGRVAKEKKEPAPGPGAQRSPVDFHHQGSTQDFFNDVAPGVDNPLSLSSVER